MTVTGNDFDLYGAPEPEDYFAATNSFLKIVLTAEDEYGLSDTVSVDVKPHVVMVNVTTKPAGLGEDRSWGRDKGGWLLRLRVSYPGGFLRLVIVIINVQAMDSNVGYCWGYC